eukprot:TRINITY_DN34287_c0_g1_i1.p1 TRINITY_DN34287_c0_g1~~TRINITY_DN34287_c0_g1_i1.p1  ORF type:complete len:648 (+),score=117.46 TRINITY_DN34287_c0_g1_i1:94-1944(+)
MGASGGKERPRPAPGSRKEKHGAKRRKDKPAPAPLLGAAQAAAPRHAGSGTPGPTDLGDCDISRALGDGDEGAAARLGERLDSKFPLPHSGSSAQASWKVPEVPKPDGTGPTDSSGDCGVDEAAQRNAQKARADRATQEADEARQQAAQLQQPPMLPYDAAAEDRCHQCGSSARLSACGGCRAVFYCGDECRNAAWPQHRPLCRWLRGIIAAERREEHQLAQDSIEAARAAAETAEAGLAAERAARRELQETQEQLGDLCSLVGDECIEAEQLKAQFSRLKAAAESIMNGYSPKEIQDKLRNAVNTCKDKLDSISTKLRFAEAQLHKQTLTKEPEEVLRSATWDSDAAHCDLAGLVAAVADKWKVSQPLCEVLVDLASQGENQSVVHEHHRARMLVILHLILKSFDMDGQAVPGERAFVLLVCIVAIGLNDMNLVNTNEAMSEAWHRVHHTLAHRVPSELVSNIENALLHPGAPEDTCCDWAMLKARVQIRSKSKEWLTHPVRFNILARQVLRLAMWHVFLLNTTEHAKYTKADHFTSARKRQTAPVRVSAPGGKDKMVQPQYSIEGFTSQGKGKRNALGAFMNGLMIPFVDTLCDICPELTPARQVCIALCGSYH